MSEQFDAERAKVLLKAMCDMIKKQIDSPYVIDILSNTAMWDEAECDGYCWYDEARALLGIEE